MVMLTPNTGCFGDVRTITESLDALCIQKSAQHGVIEPLFLEDNRGNALTLTKERYVSGLEQFWEKLEKCDNLKEKEQWFQQNGTPPHIFNFTMAWLREKF